MKAKFSLLAYTNGKRITVDITKKNPCPPEGATRFYLRYTDDSGKRHDDSLGDNFAYAWAEVRRMEAARDYEQKTGEKLPSIEKKTEEKVDQAPLAGGITKWIEHKRITPGMARGTCDRYERGLTLFQAFVKDAGLRHLRQAQDVTKEDVFRFAAYLREDRRLGPRTVYNYFRYVMFFLKGVGHQLAIPVKQWGEPPKRKPQAYSKEQLDALFLAATSEESLLFKSFLFSGMRNKELAHLTYGDINFKHSLWSVQPKADWEVKSRCSLRTVPVPAFHTADIRERMIRQGRSESDLVFPNEAGRIHNYYLEILKDLSERAVVKGRVDIHKFRSTCATMWLRDGVDVLEVARRLGHGDLKTIQQYIEMVNLESKEIMERTTKTFERFDTIRS